MKKVLKKVYPLLALTIFLCIIAVGIEVGVNLIFKDVTEYVFAEKPTVEGFLEYAKLLIIFFLISVPIEIILIYIETKYYKKSMIGLKEKYITKIFGKKINEFQEENNSKYFSNITNDMKSIEKKYIQSLVNVIRNSLVIIISLGLMLYTNLYLVLLMIVSFVIAIVISSALGGLLGKYEKEKSEMLGEYTSYSKEALSAFQIIKSNRLVDRAETQFAKFSEKVQEKNYKIDKMATIIQFGQSVFVGIVIISTLLAVLYMSIKGMVSIGTIILFISVVSGLVQAVSVLGEEVPKIKSTNTLFELMDNNLKNRDEYEETINFEALKDKLEVSNVDFSYDENEILKESNAIFEKGKKYLVIGPSGGGKSTLLKLLRKYQSPNAGEILIDGKNLKDVISEDYYARISNVEQHVFLFDDSIRNNITLYKDYTEDEINAAIKNSGLTDFINKQKDGLNTLIYDNGKNISGGERARIAIARGIIRNVDIIILDEAFQSLDKNVILEVEKTLLELKDVLLINVSHVINQETKNKYDKVYNVRGKKIQEV